MPLPRRAPCDSSDHVQVAQQFFPCAHAFRILFFDLPPGAQKQLRIVDDAVLHVARAIAPSLVDLAHFTSTELMASDRFGEALAGEAIGARNRNQILHGGPRPDFSVANVLLDRLGQLAHQSQATRDPRHAPVETPGKIVQAQTQAAMQLGKQPSLFERGFSFRRAQGSVQNQRFGFIHVPNRRAHRVPAEPLQCSNPFVAVNDQESVWFISQGDDHNGNLLASFGERSQQSLLSLRPSHPKPLVP